MSNNISEFSNVLKKIVDNGGGKDSLRDRRKTKNLLSDLAPGDKFQKEKKLLDDAYSCNAVGILLDADPSSDRHQKAVDAAKTKLIDNMSLSEAGANSILKDICDALDWDTSQLFGNNSVQQPTVSPNRPTFEQSSTVSAVDEVEQYRAAYSQPYNLPSPVTQGTMVNTQSVTQPIPIEPEKKKSTFVTVLKVIGVLMVISVIYNAITGNNGDDSIVEDIQDTQIVTETDKPSAENNLEVGGMLPVVGNETTTTVKESIDIDDEFALVSDGAVAADDNDSINTVAPVVTTEATTTADPSAGKYVVTDIAKLGYDKIQYEPIFMTYISETNILCYVTDSGDLHEYNLSTKSDTVSLSSDDVSRIIAGEPTSGYSLNEKKDNFTDVKAAGVVYNSYNKKIYLYGECLNVKDTYSRTKYDWMCEIESGTYRLYNQLFNGKDIYFLNEEEFVMPWSSWRKICNFESGDTQDVSAYNTDIDKIIEVNDNYYGVDRVWSGGTHVELYKIINVYSNDKSESLFKLAPTEYAYGTDVKDNVFYYKDTNNNVYIIDIDNMLRNDHIPIDQVYQTGKAFLGDNKCTGLYITNDSGFITYDMSDGKIKYVSKN